MRRCSRVAPRARATRATQSWGRGDFIRGLKFHGVAQEKQQGDARGMEQEPAQPGKQDMGKEPDHLVTLADTRRSGGRRHRPEKTPENAPATSARREIASLVSSFQPLPQIIGLN